MSDSSVAGTQEAQVSGLHQLAVVVDEEDLRQMRFPPVSASPEPNPRVRARATGFVIMCCVAVSALLAWAPQSAAFVSPIGGYGSSRPIRLHSSEILSSTIIKAVRKRRNGGDFSSSGLSGGTVTVEKPKTKTSTRRKVRSNALDRKLSVPPPAANANEKRRTGGKNVFKAFRPRYIQQTESLSPLYVPESEKSTTASGGSNVDTASKKIKSEPLKSRIAALLSDDDYGDARGPASTNEEAGANEIADRAAFARMSDEDKLLASQAVKKRRVDSKLYGMERKRAALSAATNRRVRASVKETGSDTISQYMKSLNQHELLTPEDELVLGRQIQILVGWEEERQKLEHELLRPPTFAQWAEVVNTTVPALKKQIRRSQRAKAAMVEANLRLVVTIARQSVKKGKTEVNFQDACQEGIIGLTKAIEKFNPELGFRFSTYAVWWIKKQVHASVSEQSRTVRLPTYAIKKINDIRIAERVLRGELGRKATDEEVSARVSMTIEQLRFYCKSAKEVLSLDKELDGRTGKSMKGESAGSGGLGDKKVTLMGDLVQDPNQDPNELASSEFLKKDVRRLINTLSPREQAVIRLRFGLDDGTPRTLDDIGKKFSVEKDRVRKIEARALLKLRQPYRNQSVKCYISDL